MPIGARSRLIQKSLVGYKENVRRYLSTTIAANFQSLINSASSSALRMRAVINCNSLRIKCKSLWLQPITVWCSSTVVGRPKLLQYNYRGISETNSIIISKGILTPTNRWRSVILILYDENRHRYRGHWLVRIWKIVPSIPALSCDCLIILICAWSCDQADPCAVSRAAIVGKRIWSKKWRDLHTIFIDKPCVRSDRLLDTNPRWHFVYIRCAMMIVEYHNR